MIDIKSVKKETVVSFRIGRVTTGTGDHFTLEVDDERSANRILSVRFDLEEASNLLSNRTVRGSAQVYVSDRIGKKLEVRRVLIKLHELYPRNDEEFKQYIADKCAVYADEGWVPDIEEFNHHHRRGDCYEVILRRWL